LKLQKAKLSSGFGGFKDIFFFFVIAETEIEAMHFQIVVRQTSRSETY